MTTEPMPENATSATPTPPDVIPPMSSDAPQDAPPPDINLADLLIALGQEKITWLSVTLMAALLGVVMSWLAQPVFVARSSILPAQQSGNTSALAGLGGLGGLAGLAGVAGLAGAMKSSDDMYIAFMRSQTVQLALIEQLNLKERYGAKTLDDTRDALNRQLSLVSDKKSGLIIVLAQDQDPAFAAQLANQQVVELNVLLSRLAVTEAQQRRMYLEQQVAKTQKDLVDAEVRFKEAQQKSGIRVTSMLAESGIRAGADLRSQIMSKELQMQTLGRFATAQNPEMVRMAGELSVLRAQLKKLEEGTGQITPASPLQQEASQAFRDLKNQEAMLDAFVRQLEVAKLDEAKEGPAVQVLDVAIAPEVRAQPQRKKMVIAYAVVGLAIGLVLAVLKALLRYLNGTPSGRARLGQFRQAWGMGFLR
jgi:uncharacterized protein involved in exopolysaccharide biosynthesis